HEIGVADPRKLGLRAEWHGYLLRERSRRQAALEAAIAGIDFELPGAVQAHPICAYKLRARILWAWNAHLYSIHLASIASPISAKSNRYRRCIQSAVSNPNPRRSARRDQAACKSHTIGLQI